MAAPPAVRVLAPVTVVIASLKRMSVASAASALVLDELEAPSTLSSAVPPLPLLAVEREDRRSVVPALIEEPSTVTVAEERPKSAARVSSSSASVSCEMASRSTAPEAVIAEPLSTEIEALEFGTSALNESAATVAVAVAVTEAAWSVAPSNVTDAPAQCVPTLGGSPFTTGTTQLSTPDAIPPETESLALRITLPRVVNEAPSRMITSAFTVKSALPRSIEPVIVTLSRLPAPLIVREVSPEIATKCVSIVRPSRTWPLTETFVPIRSTVISSARPLPSITTAPLPDIGIGSSPV